MQQILDVLFGQYADYKTANIILELIAMAFGILSVFYSRANNILVYPTGIISTGIYVYLLNEWGLIGDMIVNAYYFIMSIYGWWVWTRKVDATHVTPITNMNKKDLFVVVALFLATLVFVYIIYVWRNKLIVEKHPWIPYTDIVTTAIFFSGMWLMAKRKLQHWLFWIVANIISIPLYFLKGYTFTSIQYIIFLGLAVWGWIEWNKIIKQEQLEMAD